MWLSGAKEDDSSSDVRVRPRSGDWIIFSKSTKVRNASNYRISFIAIGQHLECSPLVLLPPEKFPIASALLGSIASAPLGSTASALLGSLRVLPREAPD